MRFAWPHLRGTNMVRSGFVRGLLSLVNGTHATGLLALVVRLSTVVDAMEFVIVEAESCRGC